MLLCFILSGKASSEKSDRTLFAATSDKFFIL